jgi:hypothetical protein
MRCCSCQVRARAAAGAITRDSPFYGELRGGSTHPHIIPWPHSICAIMTTPKCVMSHRASLHGRLLHDSSWGTNNRHHGHVQALQSASSPPAAAAHQHLACISLRYAVVLRSPARSQQQWHVCLQPCDTCVGAAKHVDHRTAPLEAVLPCCRRLPTGVLVDLLLGPRPALPWSLVLHYQDPPSSGSSSSSSTPAAAAAGAVGLHNQLDVRGELFNSMKVGGQEVAPVIRPWHQMHDL